MNVRVRCINNDVSYLSKHLRVLLGKNSNNGSGLEVGKEYLVYGQSYYNGYFNYLLEYDLQYGPAWFCSEFFEITDPQLPLEWYFNDKFINYDELKGIWGYKELLNINHYDGLINRVSEDLNIFYKRKKEIEEYDSF